MSIIRVGSDGDSGLGQCSWESRHSLIQRLARFMLAMSTHLVGLVLTQLEAGSSLVEMCNSPLETILTS